MVLILLGQLIKTKAVLDSDRSQCQYNCIRHNLDLQPQMRLSDANAEVIGKKHSSMKTKNQFLQLFPNFIFHTILFNVSLIYRAGYFTMYIFFLFFNSKAACLGYFCLTVTFLSHHPFVLSNFLRYPGCLLDSFSLIFCK